MNSILAAAVTVDITPFNVPRTYLAGFMPNRLATAVAEPLSARILYLEDKNGPLVWIALDLIGLMLPDIDRLRAQLTGVAPERVLVAATHTHSGPDTMGLWGPAVGDVPYQTGRDETYIDWMLQQVAAGVARAQIRKRPAVFGFGEDKTDKTEWVINIRQAGYHDQTMSVMRVDGVDGRPIACLTNFACHPEGLWENNTAISPDYVHYLHKRVEEETGAVSLFFNGALGGMVTLNLDNDAELSARRSFVKRAGKALGGVAVECWRAAKTKSYEEIFFQARRLTVPFDNKQLYFLANIGIFQRQVQRKKVTTCLYAARLGDTLFATLPGEPLPAVGFAIKKAMTGKFNFLFGLGGDEMGYLIDSRQAADEAYNYERSMSIGPDGVEELMRQLLKLIEEL
ncbi:MAG TPA: hypothetical protein PK961_10785 [bacterium]|nr:hypothetical protein [bacterium]